MSGWSLLTQTNLDPIVFLFFFQGKSLVEVECIDSCFAHVLGMYDVCIYIEATLSAVHWMLCDSIWPACELQLNCFGRVDACILYSVIHSVNTTV